MNWFKAEKSQLGVVHIFSLLVIIAAVGIISFLMISSTLPTSGLFGILNPKPSSQAATDGFLETFAYGAPNAPQAFKSARWIVMTARNDGLINDPVTEHPIGNVDIPAGHGPHCEPPIGNPDWRLNNHYIPNSSIGEDPTAAQIDDYLRNVEPNYIYICNKHMMTTAFGGFIEQGIISRYTLDISNGRTVTIQFDINPYSPGRAGWWELYIASPDDFLMNVFNPRSSVTFDNTDGLMGILQTNNYQNVAFPQTPGTVNTNSNHRHRFGLTRYCDVAGNYGDGAACGDPKQRRTVRLTLSKTSYSAAYVTPNGSIIGPWGGDFPVPLAFDKAIIKFGHWAYNPTKAGAFHDNPGYTQGNPFSITTYHWANLKWDGPAERWKTGYPAEPTWQNTAWNGHNWNNDANPSRIAHVNITSSDLRNPRIWGGLNTGGLQSGGNAAVVDPLNTTHWAQVSVNGGPWLDVRSVRGYHPDTFINKDNEVVDESFMTFVADLPAGSVHQGDNTIQFRHNPTGNSYNGRAINHQGFSIGYVEVQVDPNADLPPANPDPVATTAPEAGTPNPNPTNPPTPAPTPSCNKPGDSDCDGDVDIQDFNNVVSDFAKTGPNLLGDLDDDLDVDLQDFNEVVSYFNT